MKILKYIAIAFAAVVLLTTVAIGAALYIVLTPERLTPIAEKQIERQLGLDISIESADLTIFSSFPNLQIKVDGLKLSPVAEVETIIGDIDIERAMEGEIIINKLHLSGADLNIDTDQLTEMGLITATEEETQEEQTLDQNIQITEVELSDIDLNFSDSSSKISTQMEIPQLSLNGSMVSDKLAMQLAGAISIESLSVADSIAVQGVDISQLQLAADCSLESNIYDIAAKSAIQISSVALNNETLLEGAKISFDIPATIDLNGESAEFKRSSLAINDLTIEIEGAVKNQQDNNILADLHLSSNRWDYDSIIALIPAQFIEPYRGEIKILKDAGGAMQADLHAFVDLSEAQPTKLSITAAEVELGSNRVAFSGVIDDALKSINCDLNISAKANIAELLTFVPDTMDLNLAARGVVTSDLSAKFKLDDLAESRIERISAKGNIAYNNLKLNYNDSLNFADNSGRLEFALAKRPYTDRIIDLSYKGGKIDFNQIGVGRAELRAPQFSAALSNPLDTTKILSSRCDYSVEDLRFESDSIKSHITGTKGVLMLNPDRERSNIPVMAMMYHSDSLVLDMVDQVVANVGNVTIKALSKYDSKQERLLLKWNPLLSVDFNNGEINLADFDPTIYIPAIKFDYRLENMNIHDSRIKILDSDFSVNGKFGNILSCIKSDDEKLVGELNYYSEHTDLDQLMDLSTAFTTPTEEVAEEANDDEPQPFMIPKRVNIALNSEIKSANFNSNVFYDIKGSVVANGGELVMDQVGFRSEAAKMYLTAVYRPERVDHIFTGLNFHLVDVDINALVDVIPAVDSLMPMLRDFRGKGELHLAAEAYLKGNYEPKISTLRGAMAIKGQDLVLLDNETFSQASKLLLFSKKAENKIDSLSVEATLFRDEVEIFPFLLAMDRWQAIISGSQNMDLMMNYHVSVVDCPLPVKLGVDIKGSFDDMNIKLAPCRYKALYKPKKQGAVERQILEFKSIVSNSLIKNLESRKDYIPETE